MKCIKKTWTHTKFIIQNNCSVFYDFVEIHQPICPKHSGLSEIHQRTQGHEYSGHIRKGVHKYDGCQGRNPNHHHGIAGPAGIAILEPECKDGHPVPLSARKSSNQS